MRVPTMFIAAFLAMSCTSNKLYDEAIDFDDRTWKTTEPVVLEFTVPSDTTAYDLTCTVRNSLDYPYARLFVNYTLADSTGKELGKKMMVHYLFDQKTGEPQGTSGLGDIYDHQFNLLKGYRFAHAGKHKMKLEQVMRQDTLKGVLAVGLIVTPTEK